MAFISSKANRGISNKKPGEYLNGIIEKRGDEALIAQAITLNSELWEIDKFRDFLDDRRATLARAVNTFVEESVRAGRAAPISI